MTDPRKVLVFGGAGFIGTNICLSALSRGSEVVLFDDLSRPGVKDNLETIIGAGGDRVTAVIADIADFDAVDRVFTGHPDVGAVFHMAGQVAVTTSLADPRGDFEANLTGSLNILESLRLSGGKAPLVFASTNKVYGDLGDPVIEEGETRYAFRDYPDGIAEDMPLQFSTPYGCSKGAADQYILDYARHFRLDTVVMRQSCIYGPNQFGAVDQGWIAWFTIAALLGKPITLYGNGKQVRDVLYVDDLIEAYWAAIDKIDSVRGEAFNIGGGAFNLSLLELLDKLEEILGKPVEVEAGPVRAGDQKIFICDNGKAARLLGWQPTTPVDDGLGRLIEWVEANRDLI